MKSIASTVIVIIICTLSFLSCSKKKDVIPPAPNYGTVVFWTKNAANFALCSNNIRIFILLPTPYSSYIVDGTADIRYILPSAPAYCGNEAAILNIHPDTKYYYAPQNCATGQFGAVDSFSLSPGACLKIEIP